MSTVNWTPKFKNANGDEVELILGVDQVANSDGTPLTEFIANMGESSDLTYTELVEDIDGEAPDVSPVVQNAIQDAIDGITAEQVGALPLTGGTLSGDVTTLRPIIFDRGNGAYGEGRIYKANASANSALCLSDTSSDGSQMVMYLNSDKQTFQLYCKTGDEGAYHDIYHEGNKPTASDVGALPSSGGTVTKGASTVMQLKNSSANRTYLGFIGGDTLGYLGFESQDVPAFVMKSGVVKNLYHTGNITNGTTALTAKSSTLATGAIYLQYE